MISTGDLKDAATIIGSLGTGVLALIAASAAFPKIQNGIIARIGKAFNRETNLAIASLEATVRSNHVEGLERFEANEKAIESARIENNKAIVAAKEELAAVSAKAETALAAAKTELEGVAETLDVVAVMEQHTRRTLNGHLRSGRHLKKGQSTA